MSKFLYAFILQLFVLSSAIATDSVFIRINNVPLLKQPKSQDCWATVITMLYMWKEGTTDRSITYDKKETNKIISQKIRDIGDEWYNRFINNKGLNIDSKNSLLKKLNLISEPPANYTIEFYVDRLKESGPLWITTSTNPFGVNSHAKLLIGIKGDLTYENTIFEFIDPLYGKVYKQRAIDFVKEFENEAIFIVNKIKEDKRWTWDKVDFRVQIIHF